MVAQPQMLRGKVLNGRYVLDTPVGGDLDAVYSAKDTRTQQPVAIKIFRFSLPGDWQRNFQGLINLKHPNVIQVYEAATSEEGLNFIVMQWLAGGPLDVSRPRTLPEALSILKPLADGLETAHHNHIIHGYVSSDNVILGDRGQPVLIGFEIMTSSNLDPSSTSSGLSLGSYTHTAPERCQGEPLTPSADQYGLAVIAYQLVTGQLPFNPVPPTPMNYMQMHIMAQPTVPDRVPRPIREVLLKGLAKSPDERYPSVAEFAKAFEKGVQATAMAASTPLRTPSKDEDKTLLPGVMESPISDRTIPPGTANAYKSSSQPAQPAAPPPQFDSGATIPPRVQPASQPIRSQPASQPMRTPPPSQPIRSQAPASQPLRTPTPLPQPAPQPAPQQINPVMLGVALVVIAVVALLAGVLLAVLLHH